MEKYKDVLKQIITEEIVGSIDFSKAMSILYENNLVDENSFFVNNITNIKTDFKTILDNISELPSDQRLFLAILLYAFKKEQHSAEYEGLNNIIFPIIFSMDEMVRLYDIFNMQEFFDLVNDSYFSFLREHRHILEFFILNEKYENYDVDGLISKIENESTKTKLEYFPQYIVAKKFRSIISKDEANVVIGLINKGIDIKEVKKDFDGSPVVMKFEDTNKVIKRSSVLTDMVKGNEIILESKNVAKASSILRKML